MPKIKTTIEIVQSIKENLSAIFVTVANSDVKKNPSLLDILDRIVDINSELDRLNTITLSAEEAVKLSDEQQNDN